MDYPIVLTNFTVYSDSTVTEPFTLYPNFFTLNTDFYEFGESQTMVGVVNQFANDLGVDNLFEIVGYAVDFIVIAVMFVLGYMIVRKILKKISR